MILSVTPNAAIDRTLIVPGFRAGRALRPAKVLVAAGGKGINVARAIHRLGGDARCAGFLRGHAGHLVADLAAGEGLHGGWTWLAGETRTCTIIVDPDTQVTTELYEHGPPVSPEDSVRLATDVHYEAAAATAICISGTLPPGAPYDVMAAMIRDLEAAGKPVWLDSSGPALAALLMARPSTVKINAEEASALLGQQIDHAAGAVAAATALIGRGVNRVVLTLGREGAVLADAGQIWWAAPPAVEVVSPVGSGDALLGGLVLALTAGVPVPDALRQGVAAGTANAMVVGGGAFSKASMALVLAETTVRRLL